MQGKQAPRGRFYLEMKRFLTLESLGCIIYVLFYIWQVIGLILYNIRAFETSILAKHASFQLTHIPAFHHSDELQLAWSMSQIFNYALVILAVSKVPSFLGCTKILRLLIRLPGFWSLLALFVMTIVGYGMIFSLQNNKMEIALIMAFAIDNGIQVILISLLNFTQVNHSREKFPYKVFGFVKINIFLFLLSYFSTFVIGSVQFSLRVYGFDENTEISDEFRALFITLRRFTQILYCYKIFFFYWEKSFIDHRNILQSNYEYLDQLYLRSVTSAQRGLDRGAGISVIPDRQ